MFIHNMYVNILFHLTKAIPIIFECVTTHYQTLQTWAIMQCVPITSLRYHMRHHTHYPTFSIILT